ncbi:hypothetical protein ABEB36_012883 [Hypothenemus hampei]|uniref:Uncharacterized protein n=1 Tax=Hypothenemus hampei TaxID=57062 RepID=A0ABD1E637_HYPHA
MVVFPISLAISRVLVAVMIIIRRSSVVTMSWVAVSAVEEMLELVRGLVLAHAGIPLDLLEQRFWAACGGEEYNGRVYLAGVDEDSDDEHWDSDYFIDSDASTVPDSGCEDCSLSDVDMESDDNQL